MSWIPMRTQKNGRSPPNAACSNDPCSMRIPSDSMMLAYSSPPRGWRGPIQSAVSSPPVQADAIGSPTARPHRSFVLEASRNGCRQDSISPTEPTISQGRASGRKNRILRPRPQGVSPAAAPGTHRYRSRDRRPWVCPAGDRRIHPTGGDTAHSRGTTHRRHRRMRHSRPAWSHTVCPARSDHFSSAILHLRPI